MSRFPKTTSFYEIATQVFYRGDYLGCQKDYVEIDDSLSDQEWEDIMQNKIDEIDKDLSILDTPYTTTARCVTQIY